MKGKEKQCKDDCSLLPFLVEKTVHHPILLLDIKEGKILQTQCFCLHKFLLCPPQFSSSWKQIKQYYFLQIDIYKTFVDPLIVNTG